MYWTLLVASVRARMQYKVDFLLTSIATGMVMVADYLLLAAILLKFKDIRGWTIEEVGLLYGMSTMSLGLYRMFAVEIHDFDKYVVQGEFDSLLIRPVSPLVLLLTRNLDLGRIGSIAQGGMIMAWSFTQLPWEETVWPALLYLPVALATGFLIALSLGLFTATLSFWVGRIKDFQAFTLYAPFTAANFPLAVYPGWLKSIFFTVLPVGFITYLPATFLLQKGSGAWILWASPLFSLAFFGLALMFWRFGIRHYCSTGS